MSESIVRYNGLNVATSQAINVPNMTHTIIQVPSTTSPSFGGFCQFDLKQKGVKIHNLSLQITPSTVTGLTGGTNIRFVPSCLWLSRLEILINGVVMDTLYGVQMFLKNQLFRDDPERYITNSGSGDYASASTRATMTTTAQPWTISLKTLFNETHFNLVNQSHEVQVKCYFNPLSAILEVGGATGTAIATIQSANLIARVSNLDEASQNASLMFLSKSPRHYLFHELRYQPITLSAGISSASIILTGLTGNATAIFFCVRPTASTTLDASYSFTAIASYNILNSTGASLVGGSNINHNLNQQLVKFWSPSSYIVDAPRSISNSNVYCYAFSPDLFASLNSGAQLGYYKMMGNETLNINFNSALGASTQVDIWTYNYASLAQTQNGVTKITTF